MPDLFENAGNAPPLPSAPAAPMPFTHEERLVWAQLAERRGKARTISIWEISNYTGLSARDIKGAVEGLIVRHSKPIGSSRRPPHGYYLIETREELESTVRPLRAQALAMLRRVKALQGMETNWLGDLLDQLKLDA